MRVLALALAAPVLATTGTMDDMKHIVVFMQENRAFDEYYGRLAGVRGFNDRAAPPLPTGNNIFYQPTNKSDDKEYLLPFPLSFDKTAAQCIPAPSMGYYWDIGSWNGGKMDSWNTARVGGYGVSYFNRTDLPFYYSLADHFTIGDQYFQSTFTATDPNRLHLFYGSNGYSVGEIGDGGILDDTIPKDGNKWETLGETLEKAGVSWKVYQENDNFDDNGFAWFHSYRNAKEGEPLFDKGMARQPDFVKAFEDDVKNDKLPQVSYLIAPAHLSEHAENHPGDGEDLTHRLINALHSNPEVYAKTAFILNYDEGGQFVDHHWPPTPPTGPKDGASTVTTKGEVVQMKENKETRSMVMVEDDQQEGSPIGLGFRVPLMLVSPWTRGNYVYSEVADHTSVIKFIEKKFNVKHDTISPWRRAVTSDLVNAFDFAHPDYSWPASWPDTSQNVNRSAYECKHLPAPEIPKLQKLVGQEAGVRKSRPLDYNFDVSDGFDSTGDFQVFISNEGKQGASFNVYNLLDWQKQTNYTKAAPPRKYTVEAGKKLDGTWALLDGAVAYNVSLHGPNGFVRQFSGSKGSKLSAKFSEGKVGSKEVTLTFAPSDCEWTVTDAYKSTERNFAGVTVSVAATGNWYDLTVSATCDGDTTNRRFMGRLEDGTETTSDPLMNVVVNDDYSNHPQIPERLRHIKNTQPKCTRDMPKDVCYKHYIDDFPHLINMVV